MRPGLEAPIGSIVASVVHLERACQPSRGAGLAVPPTGSRAGPMSPPGPGTTATTSVTLALDPGRGELPRSSLERR